MKIKLDAEELLIQMNKAGIKTQKELCEECGISYRSYQAKKSKDGGKLSIEMIYLIAERLNCHMEDICFPDWTA